MAKRETIYTRTVTPGKRGTNISREKYEAIHDAIVRVLQGVESIEFQKLPAAVKEALKTPFEGSIPWYTTTVKLDMERRKIIERIAGVTPQRLRLRK